MKRKVSALNSVLDVRNQNKLIKNRFRAAARSRINSVAGAPSVRQFSIPRWNQIQPGGSSRAKNLKLGRSLKTLRNDKEYLSAKNISKVKRNSKSGMFLNSDERKKDKVQNNVNNIMLDNLALMARIKESGEKN